MCTIGFGPRESELSVHLFFLSQTSDMQCCHAQGSKEGFRERSRINKNRYRINLRTGARDREAKSKFRQKKNGHC